MIDYLVLHEHDFHYIHSFSIGNFCEWSAHAPLFYGIRYNPSSQESHNDSPFIRVKWKDEARDSFRRGLIGQLPKLNEIARNIDTGDRHSINTCTQSFTRALLDDCQNVRQQYINALMHLNRMKSDENKVIMCSKRNI